MFTPREHHFYIEKLGYAGVYLFFIFLLQNIDSGYSLERLAEAVLTCTHNLCFEQKYEKYQIFSAENFQFLKLKKSLFIAWAIFRNVIYCPFHHLSASSRNCLFFKIPLFLNTQEKSDHVILLQPINLKIGSLIKE